MEANKKEYDCFGFTVSFKLIEGNTWSEEDTALEEAYKALIKSQMEFLEDVFNWAKETGPINKTIEAYRSNLMLIKDLSEEARAEADACVEKMSNNQFFSKEELHEKVAICTNAINQFHEKLPVLYPQIDTLRNYLNEYAERDEDMTLWDAFDEVNLAHSHHYETNAIDVMSFDDNQNMFRDRVQYNTSRMVNYIQFMEGYYENYKRLVLEIDLQYGIWREFTKRVDLLDKIIPVEVKPISSPDNLNLN